MEALRAAIQRQFAAHRHRPVLVKAIVAHHHLPLPLSRLPDHHVVLVARRDARAAQKPLTSHEEPVLVPQAQRRAVHDRSIAKRSCDGDSRRVPGQTRER